MLNIEGQDFTLEKYSRLCESVTSAGYAPITIRDYLTSKALPESFVIMRHDIDRKPDRALDMAILENRQGIRGSYYFRTNKKVFKPGIIKKINDLGHEIGYHYEVLDTARGDPKKAIALFQRELSDLNRICTVNTICMHGNPLTKWDNRDLWKTYSFRDHGAIGEAYLSLDFEDIAYYTDTGRGWDQKFSIKDHALTPPKARFPRIASTDDLIRITAKMSVPRICILTHSERWTSGLANYLFSCCEDLSKNAIKHVYKELRQVGKGDT